MTEYWTLSTGPAIRQGWTCRECKTPIIKGHQMVIRDGRKIRLMYHHECFSGDADPRTQQQSSAHNGRLPKSSFQEKAPEKKGAGKWSTSCGYAPNTSGLDKH
jgi:RNase P subunit RPR2